MCGESINDNQQPKGIKPFPRAPSFGSPRFTFGHFVSHPKTINP